MDLIIKIATRVVTEASETKPADALLRALLKESRLPRADSAEVAELVFAYFRWRGWLGAEVAAAPQFEKAMDLDQRFQRDPISFSDEELKRAVPEWTMDHVDVSGGWLRSLQARPSLWIRAKRGQGELLAKHFGEGSIADATVPDAVQFRGETDLFRTPEFHAGEFEIQDIASQIVGLLCAPKPGETWWDACAGEGGKMLHLSELMENKGLIWASDRADWRLKRLKQRAGRAKVFNYRAALWDGSTRLPTKTKFDGILVDAPCSGVGTWQRNPHARWTTTANDVRELGELQKQLLTNAAAAVKPGGKLIYSVCTLTRSETDAVADFCSQALRGFAPLALPALPNERPASSARRWIWPQQFFGNGMFVAAWEAAK
ncbi:MAG TPA: RsmB/NOP family class I SAM-dependent RNA methyltransferase [Candidatus Acidoferrum sp.]|nr:RsmB/NOP family class I SAM-dependent RNA methyltransferase [Candidatus Acidoferrum sp.]